MIALLIEAVDGIAGKTFNVFVEDLVLYVEGRFGDAGAESNIGPIDGPSEIIEIM